VIAVVVVNWNGRQLLDSCLESLYREPQPADLVIVVDNGSADDSVAHLGTAWPAAQVLSLGRNLGVAAGNNAGIRAALAAGARHVLLLNNDAELCPGALGALAEALTNAGPDLWAVAPKIVYRRDPSRIWSAGGEFNWWRGVSRDRGTDELDRGQYNEPADIDYANTCCLLVRADAFRTVGLMDEAYYMYYDDSDFAARLRRCGGRIRYIPAACVLHDVQASSQRGSVGPSPFALYYSTRNRARFIRRNAPSGVHRLIAHTFTIVSRLARVSAAGLQGRAAEARLVLGALYDGYLRREIGATSRMIPASRK
jgi:GT2 family glycosyltransferase